MKTATCIIALTAALALTGAASAQDFQPKTKGLVMLNVRASAVVPSGSDPILTAAGAATGLRADVKTDYKPSIGLSYFLSDNVAVEVIATTTEHKVRARGPATDVTVHKTWVLPPVVSLQYHFAPAAQVSPYVGMGLNYMLFHSSRNQNGFTVKLKDGFGYALQTGVDVAVGGPWSANVDVKKVFFDTKASINGGTLKSKVNLDPWVISAGVGYKF